MTDKEQNKSEVEQAPTSKDDSTWMNLRGKDRRRFIKRAIIAAPFILTVTSRPVWAINCTLSGQLSGNLSDPDGTCGGEGCSAVYWEGNTDMWHYEFQPGCVFDSVFELSTTVFGTYTLLDVISYNVSGVPAWKKGLGSEAVAALQNAATRVSYDYMVCEVIDKVGSAFDSGNKDIIEQLEKTLKGLNGQSCPFAP